jgi:hypothetical protein
MAVLVAFLFAGYYVWKADHIRLMPGLKVTSIRHQPTPVLNSDTRTMAWNRPYVQLVVECQNEVPVYADGTLLRIMQWDREKDDWKETVMNEATTLEWSHEKLRRFWLNQGYYGG